MLTSDNITPAGGFVIRKEILRDKIYEVLREWILDGTLEPGSRLNESDLASRLKVSRAPFREALWLLSRAGLVRIYAHHGAFVTKLTPEDIREIFEIRETLETQAAKKVRANPPPDAKVRLEDALRNLEDAAKERDLPRWSQADLEFHRTIWQLAGNRHLEEMLTDVSARFFGYELIHDLPHSDAYRFEAMVDEHRRMVQLILHGTEKEIEAGFRKAFAAFLDYVLARVDRKPPA